MKKQVILGLLVAVIVIGGIALHLNAKKAPAVVQESQPPVTVEATETETAPKLADGTYTVAADKSTAEWSGTKPLLTDYKDTGTIAVKTGSFIVKDGALASGSIVFDMNSIKGLTTGKKMGEGMMEKHLKSADFFNVEKYPTAEFKMKEAATGATAGHYVVKGDLTIKGITNAVELPVVVSTVDKTMTIDSTVTLDRTKWDIRYGSGKFFDNLANNVIDDNFTVAFKFVADMQ